LRTDLHGPVHGELPFSSPWRVFIIGDRPGDLVEKNYLVLNLNAPCVMDDPSWIRPGKVLRVGLSTVDGKEGIDFAAEHGLQYILFDWGWYGGPTDTDVPDARFEDPHNPMSGEKLPGKGLNVKEVVEYGRDKGIGVWLYVNHQALERQMDELFPLYRRWGVAGVKAGFVKFGIQAWSKWHCDMIRKAAEHKLMVNIHDEYRPTGFARTYPNIVTQEGIRGNENSPGARHNTLLPFVRYPAGAGDYTPCYYTVADKGPERNTTCAHQLALPIVFYSPSMHCFWYDNPAAYRGEQEIELWESLPTTWNETRVLDAVIGEYVTVARRSGNDWYVGSLTNEDARSLEVPLDFLEPGVTYDALTCSDDPGADTRTQVKTEKIEVTAETIVRAELAARGGHAIRLKPRV